MEGRKNTVLLTIIGIATLLIAVAGATFAFFTAQFQYDNDATSTLRITTGNGSTMDVETDSVVITDIYPRGTEGTIGTAPNDYLWASKAIAITVPQNQNASSPIEYQLGLNFDHNYGTGNGLYYTFEPMAVNAGACLKQKAATKDKTDDLEYTDQASCTSTYWKTTNVTGTMAAQSGSIGLPNGSAAADINFGTGTFAAAALQAGEVTHVYRLRIFMLDTGSNQNANQGKAFYANFTVAGLNS